jgi:hypothetical protein
MREWSVPCEWCDAKIGEPCRDNHDVALNKMIHRPRAFLWDRENGLRRREAPTLTPTEVNKIEGR